MRAIVRFSLGLIRALGWGLMALIAALIFQSSWIYYSRTDTGFLTSRAEALSAWYYLPAFYAHISAASLAIFLAFFQRIGFIRDQWPRWHRYAGRLYVVLVLTLAAPGGFFMGLWALGGWPSVLSFSLMAGLWAWHSWQLGRKAKQGDYQAHTYHADLSLGLALSAPLLRLYSFLAYLLFAWRGPEVYIALVWLSWSPQYLWVLLRRVN